MQTQSLFEMSSEINSEIKRMVLSDQFDPGAKDTDLLEPTTAHLIQAKIKNLPLPQKSRLEEEYFGLGPLARLLEDNSISEILIFDYKTLWLEKEGRFESSPDSFYSEFTFQSFLHRLFLEIKAEPSLSQPFVDSEWKGLRLHIIGIYEAHQKSVSLSLRKPRKDGWTLEKLQAANWASEADFESLKKVIKNHDNILVVGPTSAGKTSVLKALLAEVNKDERLVILEDSAELEPPTALSTRLLTRSDSQSGLPKITLTDLVRQSLRMRPDRIVVGEVRGDEAKDMLMALATGHAGSFCTLHASDPHQALIRLEMLIQMGAPQWGLVAIRRLILFSLQIIVVCKREAGGKRRLDGIYKISSLEEAGFTLEPYLLV